MPVARPATRLLRLPGTLLVCLALATLGTLTTLAQTEPPPEPPAVPPAEPSPVEPLLAFEPEAVTATGLTPGGEVLIYAVGRQAFQYHTRVSHWQEAVLADEGGGLRYDVADGVPTASIWVVVDLATGALDLSPAPGFTPPEGPLPPQALRGQGAGRLNRLVRDMEEAWVLLVRPGVGAWSVRMADGGSADVDGANDGALEVALDALEPAAPSSPAAPDGVEAGDVLVVIDPGSLQLLTLRVGPRA